MLCYWTDTLSWPPKLHQVINPLTITVLCTCCDQTCMSLQESVVISGTKTFHGKPSYVFTVMEMVCYLNRLAWPYYCCVLLETDMCIVLDVVMYHVSGTGQVSISSDCVVNIVWAGIRWWVNDKRNLFNISCVSCICSFYIFVAWACTNTRTNNITRHHVTHHVTCAGGLIRDQSNNITLYTILWTALLWDV